ncbi:MAG: hypothetical protein HY901_07535 [Deltaproteobacteria bacterium]|nr:hypothetical protein [Deltaproteobacteria bacterium]
MASTDAAEPNRRALVGSIRFVATLGLGLLSCALAFFITYEAAKAGLNLMGWYVNWVMPVGPLLVGLAASSGIALGAWLFGVRMSGISLAATLLLLGGAFFGAEYVAFRVLYPGGVADDQGNVLGFWGYFDAATRMIHFENRRALGLFGYLMRVLDFLAFSAGGVLGPLLLLVGRPYCRACYRYHRNSVLAHVPAGNEEGIAELRDTRSNAAQFTSNLIKIAPKETWEETARSGERILFRLSWCPSCRDGQLILEKLAGLPDQKSGRVLEQLPVPSRVVGDLLASQRAA